MMADDTLDEGNLDGLRKTTIQMVAICHMDEQMVDSKTTNSVVEVVTCALLLQHV